MKVKKLNGMKVITVDAYSLGEVDGANFSKDTWEITELDVKLSGDASKELGLKKPRLMSLTVCLPVNVIKTVGDVITLEQTISEFKNLGVCKMD